MVPSLDEEALAWLVTLSEAGDPPPWTAMVEGREHASGDSFIMTGTPDDRREDVYVTRDSAPAIPVELDLIAAARTYLVCWWRRFGGCGTHRPATSGAPHQSRISPALVGVKPQASK